MQRGLGCSYFYHTSVKWSRNVLYASLNKQPLIFQNCLGFLCRLRCQGKIKRLWLVAALPASNMTLCRGLCLRATGWMGRMYVVNPLRVFGPAPKLFFVKVTFITELLKVFSRKEKLKNFTRYPPQNKYTQMCIHQVLLFVN